MLPFKGIMLPFEGIIPPFEESMLSSEGRLLSSFKYALLIRSLKGDPRENNNGYIKFIIYIKVFIWDDIIKI